MNKKYVQEAKEEINRIDASRNYVDIMYEVAAVITTLMDKLDDHPEKINRPIIVGGLSMEFHTDSAYTTRDIDFVTSASLEMQSILHELGFKKEARIFIHDKLNIAVDIANNSLEYSESYSRIIKVKVGKNYFYVVSPEDMLIDRILDYSYADNYDYCLLLIANKFEALDVDYIRDKIKWDKSALNEFENILDKIEHELNKD
ncbi:hypothetical protein KXQ08_001256 [Staphylococcus pseudintermedius]|nr:hypothetical protein [Staphylococcus pseudintermedius]